MKAKAFKPRGSVFNPRTITAPIAALVMAGILYTYSVTSIRAAKRNAQLHREADGGQLDMRRESLRRHGILDQVEGTRGIELFKDARPGGVAVAEAAKNETDHMGEKKAKSLDEVLNLPNEEPPKGADAAKPEGGKSRTDVERGLESYKGYGNAVRQFREGKGD